MRSLVGAQLAVPAFILVWSSGYVVARLAASDAEPLSFLVLRYLFVSLLMGVLAWVARVPWPRGQELRHVIIVGVLLQATYLGGVWVAIRQGMPAGLAALIVNLQPVLTACLAAWAGESISRRQILGVILGFAGVIVVLWNKLVDAASAAYGPILLCLLALLGATLAVIYQKKHVSQLDLRSTQAVQFAASILVTLPFVMIFESFNIR